MKITCSSTYTALISAKSSDCFNSILKKINSKLKRKVYELMKLINYWDKFFIYEISKKYQW